MKLANKDFLKLCVICSRRKDGYRRVEDRKFLQRIRKNKRKKGRSEEEREGKKKKRSKGVRKKKYLLNSVEWENI